MRIPILEYHQDEGGHFMGIILVLVVRCLSVQDAESRYREALYHEVDKGELDKALELYTNVRSDSSAPEATRARAAYRRAWCLEKKGQKAEAESAYREVVAHFVGLPEVTQKARERLDRWVTGEGRSSGPVTLEERIAGLVLSLGSYTPETRNNAQRSLLLIGEPAVPALRQALTHKDMTLSGQAACTLVELQKDEGTGPVLMRLLGEETRIDFESSVAAFLKRNPDSLKDFLQGFRAATKREVINNYLGVLRNVRIPEARERLHELVVRGPLDSLGDTLFALHLTEEKEFFDLLSNLEKADNRFHRVYSLMGGGNPVDVKVIHPREFARHLAAVVPEFDPPWTSIFLPAAQEFAPLKVILQECAGSWLRRGNKEVCSWVLREISSLNADRFPVLIQVLEEDLSDATRYDVLKKLRQPVGQVALDAETQTALEKGLWAAFDNGKKGIRQAAAEDLLPIVPETHPRWEELIVWELAQPLPPKDRFGNRQSLSKDPETTSCDFSFLFYPEFAKEAQEHVRRIVYRLMREGDEATRERALEVSSDFGLNDRARAEALSQMALETTHGEKLRGSAVEGMKGLEEKSPTVRKALVELIKDKSPAIRKAAVMVLKTSRGSETDGLLAALLGDPDGKVAWEAAVYFWTDSRPEYLDPLVRALKSPHSRVRGPAARGLGLLESLKAVPYLIETLEDVDADVRFASREALERIKKHYEEKAQWREWYERVKPKEK